MKIAVTGASGHIGNTLCRRLAEAGNQVKALIHTNRDELAPLGVDMIQGDILNPETLNELVEGVDRVYHLAAKIALDNKAERQLRVINVQGTENVINACVKQKVGRLIHFSTIHTLHVEDPESMIDESYPLIEHSPISYEQTKADAERLIMNAVRQGLDTVIVNPTAVFGPFDYRPSFLGQALIRIYRNRLPMLIQGGYNFVDVRDVVEGALLAAERGRNGNRYILGGQWLSLKELSVLISQISGHKTPQYVGAPFLARLGLPFIRLFAMISGEEPLYTAQSLHILKHSGRSISHAKASRELGYHPRPILESLKETFNWFSNHGKL
ncbi:MAG: NAD-dependent epimerase/dehydratase family protein [Bacteroidetes bacterium]|nr:NAD-dependent epimerase/dehydratase family protein [Bacteroidota bacterium]